MSENEVIMYNHYENKCVYTDEIYCINGSCETCGYAKEIKKQKLNKIQKDLIAIQISIDDFIKEDIEGK